MVNQIAQQQDLPHRLKMRAGHAKGHHGSAVARQQGWNDRMHGALAPGDRIRMPRFNNKTRTSVMKHDA